jgi:hypothetical protein
VISGGLISQLQSLDVSVNKQFKNYLRKEYRVLLLSENFPLTPSGKIKRASASKLAKGSQPLGRRLQEKQWNCYSRNALQIPLIVQKVTVLILISLI